MQTGSMCVEAPNGVFSVGTRLALAPCAGTAGQVFQASAAPNTNRIQVTAAATACIAATSTAVGSAVSLATCSTSDSQKWAVDAVGRLLPRNAMMLCLDTESGSSATGARLVLKTCSDAPSQKFAAAAAGKAPDLSMSHNPCKHSSVQTLTGLQQPTSMLRRACSRCCSYGSTARLLHAVYVMLTHVLVVCHGVLFCSGVHRACGHCQWCIALCQHRIWREMQWYL